MNKDELLKIYSAHLPYQTKCYCMGEQDEDGKPIMFEINGFTHDLVEVLEYNTTNITHFDYDEIFPILYDLSYLTKEIEHEGEKIIPMVYFIKKTSLFDLSKCTFEVYEDDGEVYVNAHDGDRVIDSIFYDGNIFWSSKLLDIHEGYRPANPQHTWQEMLTYLHFNVFNLPEDQFINKATLTTNK